METLSELIAPIRFMIPVAIAGMIATYLEWQFPRRDGPVALSRWYNSVMLYLVAAPILAVAMPALGFALAKWSEQQGGGLSNWDALPLWVRIVGTVLILDFASFLAHYLMHKFRVLWRLHRVHHSDTQISASTSFLHHPMESLVLNSAGLVMALMLGLQAEGMLVFGFFQFVFNIWHHSNVANFPGQHALGVVVFTPDLHRVHHSMDKAHYNTNLGLIFTIWDRMFGTFVGERDLDQRIDFGLDETEWAHGHEIGSLLIDPLRK